MQTIVQHKGITVPTPCELREPLNYIFMSMNEVYVGALSLTHAYVFMIAEPEDGGIQEIYKVALP